MIELRFSSLVAAPADEVWSRVSTMAGVNAELMPLVRMTYPADRAALSVQPVPLGEVLFKSWLLLFGFIPMDLHSLCLERLQERGFDERSSSWLQKTWIHRRRVTVEGSGTRVTDELGIEPRLPFAAPLVRLIVHAIFTHRHRQLQRQFGCG